MAKQNDKKGNNRAKGNGKGRQPLIQQKGEERRSDYGRWRPGFFEAFSKTGTIMGACEWLEMERKERGSAIFTVSRGTVYKHLEEDPSFIAGLKQARVRFVERLITICHARAIDKSDYLLWKLLKTYRSDIFKEYYEHTGPGGGPINLLQVKFDLGKLSTPQLRLYEQLTRKIQLAAPGEADGEGGNEEWEKEPTRFPE